MSFQTSKKFKRKRNMKQKIMIAIAAGATFAFAAACGGDTATNANMAANRMNTNTMSNSNMMSNANMMANNSNMMSGSNTMGSTKENPMVGGAAMYANKNIIDNAVNSKDHTTLVAAVKAAGLVETLKGTGPFTVFAPTNAAFDKLPKGTVETLVKPESKAALTKILTYHVVAGKQDAASIVKAIETGNGKATFKTVQGGTLTATLEGKDVILTDEKGGKSKVTTADVMQSNGVIHVVDTVLMPK
jgi:uncharacterized surface protein with fasciclin (FAS1) repeats